MAEKLSQELFGIFGWETVGPRNQNWMCVNHEAHKTKAGTHPSDLVFRYNDPHTNYTIYLNSDVKSYAKTTINKTSLTIALNSLADATNCANASEEWASIYTREGELRRTYGLLFIYNHDGEYDKDFVAMQEKVPVDRVPLGKNNRVYVFSPQLISYLTTVAQDIKVLYAGGTYAFHYPDMIYAHPRHHELNVASVDYLLGPWQIVKGKKNDGSEQITCYYVGTGQEPDEFKFLVDYLFRFQLVESIPISVRLPHAGDDAQRNFLKAKAEYATDFYDLDEFQKRLALIRFYPVTSTVRRFSTENIGLEVR